ncbi:YutD family protein [Lactobacillus sp. ESL0791]|uniref:YutD family protein n=1 Tax=Lactobacillus sp. ESL0791 TaxID=2983234 RepID=UPI0023F6EDE2|nr:YutD family protein [Lactobacillus sp. ESL0791]MDF7638480.1 YutD family protein [Lactobacillus sp. ESL0791]
MTGENYKSNSAQTDERDSAAKRENKFQKEQPVRHSLAKVAQDGTELKINNQLYKVLLNKNDALDTEMLRKKYDPYLDQYDFLVGDVSSDHLRLKGFFQENVRAALDKKEQTIADYLFEYCNPGGPYFVLQLVTPVHQYKTHERKRHGRFSSQHSRYRKNNTGNNFKKRRVHQTKFKKKETVAVKKEHGNHHSFVIRKRRGSNQ